MKKIKISKIMYQVKMTGNHTPTITYGGIKKLGQKP